MHREDLQFLVRTAIAARHPVELHRLLGRHGTVAFAQALSPWSVRAVEDGLALLAPAARTAVFHQLPPATRDRLRAQPRRVSADAGRAPAHPQVCPVAGDRTGWLIHRFAGLLDGWSGWPGLGVGRIGAEGAAARVRTTSTLRGVRSAPASASAARLSAVRPSTHRDAGATASRAVAMTWAADL